MTFFGGVGFGGSLSEVGGDGGIIDGGPFNSGGGVVGFCPPENNE